MTTSSDYFLGFKTAPPKQELHNEYIATVMMAIIISVMVMIIGSMGISMYNLADTFVSEEAACQAKQGMILMSVFAAAGFACFAYLMFLLGEQHKEVLPSSGSYVRYFKKGWKKIHSEYIVGITLSVLLIVMCYLGYYRIYENVATWKTPDQACTQGPAVANPEGTADSLGEFFMVKMWIGVALLVVFVSLYIHLMYKERKLKASSSSS